MNIDKTIIIKIQGGLGNQLFQYSTGYSLSELNRCELKVDLSFYENPLYSEIFRLNNYNVDLKIATKYEIKSLKSSQFYYQLNKILAKLHIRYRVLSSKHFIEKKNYDNTNRLKGISPPIYMEGWFINYNVFNHVRDKLLDIYTLKDEYSLFNESYEYFSKKINSSNSVAIHIRRGDYVNNSYFYSLNRSYYQNAIEVIKSKITDPSFFVFSDDLNAARELLPKNLNITFVDKFNSKGSSYNTKYDIYDMELISRCKHIIIANSTFSWWAAYRNLYSKKIVIAPKFWFNDKLAQSYFNNISFYPDTWIRI